MSDSWPPQDLTEDEPILSGDIHEYEWTRDIPLTCVCRWEWNNNIRAYELADYGYGCPWHAAEEGT